MKAFCILSPSVPELWGKNDCASGNIVDDDGERIVSFGDGDTNDTNDGNTTDCTITDDSVSDETIDDGNIDDVVDVTFFDSEINTLVEVLLILLFRL